jgi:N-acetylglucosamine-6-phosphate deacetylase
MRIDFRGPAWIDGAFRRGVVLEIDEGKITSVSHGEIHSGETDEMVLVPGFIDLHVHGGAGSDFMDGSEEAVEQICAHHLLHGTTSLAATTLSARSEDVSAALSAIHRHSRRDSAGEAEIVAVHLEGPYINPDFAGAQDRASIRKADLHEVERWLSIVGELPMIMTFAPEVSGAELLLERFRDRIVFSIGHSGATYSEAVQAIARGARHFTHLFNAMSPLHHRNPGVVGAAIASPEATAELIADGHHVHPVVLHSFATLLHDRAVLVTDAMRACGQPDGNYKLYEHDVIVSDGAARLGSGALAGSVLTMIGAVRNMVELAGLPLTTVLPMATTHPAARIGAANRKGRIAAGFDADLLVLGTELEILRIWKGGTEQ